MTDLGRLDAWARQHDRCWSLTRDDAGYVVAVGDDVAFDECATAATLGAVLALAVATLCPAPCDDAPVHALCHHAKEEKP